MQQSKLYTELANTYDVFHQKHLNYSKIAKQIDSLLQKHKAKKILHVGSGPGRLSKILFQKYKYDIHLLDVSPQMISLSQDLLPKQPHTLADMRDFYLDDEFDVVVLAAGVFRHLLMDEDAQEALEKFHDSLKIDGVLIIDNIFPKKLIEGGAGESKKEIKNKGKTITQYSNITIENYEPTIARAKVSIRIVSEGEVSFEEYEHLFRAFSQDEVKKLLKKGDFEFLEFEDGIDSASYFTVAKAG